jgi:tetratricopeptide (TPR) repeat protein
MRKSTFFMGAGVAILLCAPAFIRWVPAGHAGAIGSGQDARALPSGISLRLPFSEPPAIYPLEIGPFSDEAPFRATDGRLYQARFTVSGRIHDGHILDFHAQAAGHGVGRVMTQGASHGIAAAASTLAPADIAGGGLQAPARDQAAALLAQVGLTDVSLEVVIDSPESILRLARALSPDALAGIVKPTAEAAIAADGNSWEAHAALGLALESERDPRGAEAAYLDALAINPVALEPMAQLAGIYKAVGEFERLERLLSAALQASPSSVPHLNWLAGTYMEQGLLDRASGVFLSALDLEPGNTVILNNLGGVYLKQGRGGEAIAIFRRAVAAAPKERPGLYNLGVALCSNGECKEGLEHLMAADRVAPGRESILSAIARGLRSLGRTSEARDWERRAREAGGAASTP